MVRINDVPIWQVNKPIVESVTQLPVVLRLWTIWQRSFRSEQHSLAKAALTPTS